MEARVVQVPAASPRACICGSETGPFVDTGYQTVDTAAIYICEKCCASVGAAFEYATPDEVRGLKDVIADLEEEVAMLRDSLDEARNSRVVPMAEVAEHLRDELLATAAKAH